MSSIKAFSLLLVTAYACSAGVLADTVDVASADSRAQSGVSQEDADRDKILELVKETTGYELDIDGSIDWSLVQPWGEAVDNVDEIIARIGADAGITNRVVVIDHHRRVVKLIVLGADASVVDLQGPAAAHAGRNLKGQAYQPSEMDYLTSEGIAAAKRAYLASKAEVSDDTEISPPSEFGPGLTLGELKGAIAVFESNEAMANENDVVAPGGGMGDGITRGQLEALKRHYRESMRNKDPYAELTPPSKEGPSLTTFDVEGAKGVGNSLTEMGGDGNFPD